MTLVREAFPNTFSHSTLQQRVLWEAEFTFDDTILSAIVYAHETDQIACEENIECINAQAVRLLTDIFKLKELFPQDITILDFLQFVVSTSTLNYFSNRRIQGSCFDWICNSLSDELTKDGRCDYKPMRIFEFGQTQHPFIEGNFITYTKVWVNDLFYYSYYTGGHKGLSEIFVATCLDMFLTIVKLTPDVAGINATDQIIAWCNMHNKVEEIKKCSSLLYEIFRSQDNPEILKTIGYHFAIAGYNGTDKSKREWCNEVSEKYGSLLNNQEKMQLILNTYDHDVQALEENFDKVIEAVSDFRESKKNPDELYSYYLSRLFNLLYNAVYKLLINGHVQKANELIGTYYGVSPNQLILPTNFYVIPNDVDSVTYAFEKLVLRQPRVNDDLIKIVKAENEFLGSTHQLNDVLEFEPPLPKRGIGQPDIDKGNTFYELLNKHLNVRKLFEKANLSSITGFNELHGMLWPIQQLIAKDLQMTFPIIHTFKKPYRARRIQKVYLWQGETQLAEYEKIGLMEIFEAIGVEFVFTVAAESSKAQFLNHYHDAGYDVFWVICHGQFDHYQPHNSHLDLGNGILVTATELHYKDASFQRRLLVLDACDGSTISMNNNFFALGIGPSMVDAEQSLLSHSWPVSDLAGLTYGLLLASHLISGSTYAEAHCKSMNLFCSGKEEVLRHIAISLKNEDVIERIKNGRIEFENFYYWGSLTYME